jgi:hypothetical protein
VSSDLPQVVCVDKLTANVIVRRSSIQAGD